jgi:YD repeat-containing protein
LTSAVAAGGLQGNYPQESYAYDPTNGTGNLSAKAGQSLTYAVQAASCPEGGAEQDPRGHQPGCRQLLLRPERQYDPAHGGGVTFTLSYDAENRLVGVTWGTSNSAAFNYDDDGKRVKSVITVNGVTTTTGYIGNYYEVSGGVITKYYYAGGQRFVAHEGGQRVAMRRGGEWYFLFGDQLGSTGATWQVSSGVLTKQGYKPWGEVRTSTSNALPTDETYTGQRQESGLGGANLCASQSSFHVAYCAHCFSQSTSSRAFSGVSASAKMRSTGSVPEKRSSTQPSPSKYSLVPSSSRTRTTG